ncbi:glycosyltransferase family 4 protein [Novipirellula artificiosorum]|uniref:GDP-mannose-dependent alpha-(1-6)-phosphatidylinositol monomannoside mannosyltransferase n=1 Tax=Novipirellula artificiosorum TaxID=2528016 RepID=A0A5C6DWM4_9BACT|nr:glycosyltransferase family 4 protein [Novipirellula artificiosorum]TWU39199.1 GDP-mannose-dependent alpha-(1-6)-phosphatidylinositol monomannoside mannosyltransferase [Novipirellula artificiosorum]
MKYLIMSDEHRPTIGGIARISGALADGLTDRGHQVTVLTNRNRTGVNDYGDEKAEIKYYSKPKSTLLGKAYLTSVWPISAGRWIRQQCFDRILVVDPMNALPLPLMTKLGSINYDILLYGSELIRYSKNRLTDRLLRKSLDGAARIFTITKYVDHELHSKYGKSSYIAYCGVGEKFFSEPREPSQIARLRERYGFASTDFIVGTISRLDERKGNDLVIDAVQRLAPQYPNLRYLIGGVGPQYDHLEAMISRYKLADRVILAGRIPEAELVSHYDLLNAYVMPNRLLENQTVEGFGISFVEAASRGVLSIGVDNGGAGEAVSDKVSGVLLPTADVDLLTDALDRILSGSLVFDGEMIRQHGRQFTWDRFVDQIVDPVAEESDSNC